MHPPSGQNRASSILSFLSTASAIRIIEMLARISVGTDRRVISPELLQLFMVPFKGSSL